MLFRIAFKQKLFGTELRFEICLGHIWSNMHAWMGLEEENWEEADYPLTNSIHVWHTYLMGNMVQEKCMDNEAKRHQIRHYMESNHNQSHWAAGGSKGTCRISFCQWAPFLSCKIDLFIFLATVLIGLLP